MKNIYIIGFSRDGRGAIVNWAQAADTMENADKVVEEWKAAGINGVQIIEK